MSRSPPRAGRGTASRDRRAQSETIGLVLVLGFVIAGSVLIVVLGASALDGGEQNLQNNRAEKALTQFDSKAALVALGNTDTQTISLAQRGAEKMAVREEAGWMRITIDNESDGQGPKTLLNQTLGSVVYEQDGTTIAYQGGGVWRSGSNNSKMVSPPEFHFRNGTLTLPVIRVSGDRRLNDQATVSHRQTTKQFPNATQDGNFTNPLTEHRVKITVQSDYYKGWGSYFEERTDGAVSYDHDRKIVNLTLVTPLDNNKLTAATASLAASGDFIISGKAGSDCNDANYTNSYNSENGSYCSQPVGTDGDIVYGGNVNISKGVGTSYIRGDVDSGRTIYVSGSGGSGQTNISGNLNYTDDCVTKGGGGKDTTCSDRIDPPSSGSVNQINGIPTAPRINSIIDATVDEIEDNNDNSDPPITGDTLDYTSGEVELEAGDYYLENIDVDDDDRIEFDTSDGNILVAVRGDVEMDDNATITVTGNNTVKIYVAGESSFSNADDWTWDMNKNTDVETPGDDATQFRVYGKDDFKFRIDSGDDHGFVGAIYAPPGESGDGEVVIDEGHIYGGILTGTTTIETKGSIHYDKALRDTKIITRSEKIVKVTYLHVSINRINVTG